ncbi:MAG: hypothetical protein GXP42_13535 [Chloroflexi bacterium]|nr:hypothetical protein [Chloroflexota bacterium]
MSKFLVIGLDGATWDVLRPWADEGALPALARVMEEGIWGPLESSMPPITAAAWASFMTGKWPSGHGVFDFFRGRAGRWRLVNGTDVDGATLWRTLSDGGRSVGVLNVPLTYPPEKVNGFIVAGLLSPDRGETTHPAGFLAPYRKALGPYRLTPSALYRPGQEDAFVADLQAVMEQQIRYALRLAQERPTDFFMVHFLATDIAQHALWRYMDASHPWHEPRLAERYRDVVKGLFMRADEALGRLREILGEERVALVMSDHGFGPVRWTVNINMWFLEQGLMKLKGGARSRGRGWLARGRVRDGLARRVARIWGRETLLGFEDVDWSRTVAYSMGHLGQVYVNVRGREPEGTVSRQDYERVREEVIEALHALRDPETGEKLVLEVLRAEDAGDGPYRWQGPDVFVTFKEASAYPMFASDGRVVSERRHGNSGDHRREGMFAMAGPGVRRVGRMEGARIVDLAPTIAAMMGVRFPVQGDGDVLQVGLSSGGWSSGEEKGGASENQAGAERMAVLSREEEEAVARRLRGLGYLG